MLDWSSGSFSLNLTGSGFIGICPQLFNDLISETIFLVSVFDLKHLGGKSSVHQSERFGKSPQRLIHIFYIITFGY